MPPSDSSQVQVLSVRNPFGPYKKGDGDKALTIGPYDRGDVISDPDEIAAVLEDHADKVNKVQMAAEHVREHAEVRAKRIGVAGPAVIETRAADPAPPAAASSAGHPGADDQHGS